MFGVFEAARQARQAAILAEAMLMQEQKRLGAVQNTVPGGYYTRDWMVRHYIENPRKYGFRWVPGRECWQRERDGMVDVLHAAPPLPFFLDPEQIAELTPEIDWSRRVGDRIRHFEDWGRAYVG
jgi:hypothetical protein